MIIMQNVFFKPIAPLIIETLTNIYIFKLCRVLANNHILTQFFAEEAAIDKAVFKSFAIFIGKHLC